MTQVFGSFLAISGVTPFAHAGTTGSGEAEQARLRDEVTAARNALDALVLQKGMKLDDPRVKEKSAALEEKLKAFRQGFQESQKRAPPPANYPRSPDPANGEKDEPPENDGIAPRLPTTGAPPPATKTASPARESAPATPETVLSGEGVKKEITYEKKTKTGKAEKPVPKLPSRVDAAEEPLPADTNTPDAAGLSEIQYQKKKKAGDGK
ncbi:MAG: hypothetical protein JST04_02570 [Bdellovibrionales bacterium]|nr:hypothetical protein [Bdellovibrionales bacterium]